MGLPSDLIEDLSSHAYPAWLGERFHTCCHVHGVAKDVAARVYDIPYVDAYSDRDSPVRATVLVEPPHLLLGFKRAVHGLDCARELDEERIAHGLHYRAAELR